MMHSYTGIPSGRTRAMDSRPSQEAVLAFINERLAQGMSPTVEEIRAHMGWKNLKSARQCLRLLNARGLLPFGYDRSELGLPASYRGKRVLTVNGWEAA